MGKAQAMAHDPNMTMEKAKAIADVLEEGYIKTGSEKIILHVEVVQDIMEGSGFIDEAKVLDRVKMLSQTDNNTEDKFTLYGPLAVIKNKVITTGYGALRITDDKTGERVEVIEGEISCFFVANGHTLYTTDGDYKKEAKKVYKVDISTNKVEIIKEISPSEKGLEEWELGFSVEVIGCSEKYLYLQEWYEYTPYTMCLNLETGEYKEMPLSVRDKCSPSEIMVYKDKIYYNDNYAEAVLDPLYVANPDGSGGKVFVEKVIDYKLQENKLYYTCSDTYDYYYDYQKDVDIRVIDLDTGEDTYIGKGNAYIEVAEFGVATGNWENGYAIKYQDGREKKIYSTSVHKLSDDSILFSTQGENYWENDTRHVVVLEDKISKPFYLRFEREVYAYSDGKVYYTDGDLYGSYELEFADENEGYKEAYAEFLEEKLFSVENPDDISNERCGFELAYIDEDDIPELVYSYGDYHAAGADIFFYKDGKVSTAKINGEVYDKGTFGSYGIFSYVEKGNMIMTEYSGMGISTEGIYELKNSDTELIRFFYVDWNDEKNKVYEIDDKIVSESEFYEEIEQYKKMNWKATRGDDGFYLLNQKNIDEVFRIK